MTVTLLEGAGTRKHRPHVCHPRGDLPANIMAKAMALLMHWGEIYGAGAQLIHIANSRACHSISAKAETIKLLGEWAARQEGASECTTTRRQRHHSFICDPVTAT